MFGLGLYALWAKCIPESQFHLMQELSFLLKKLHHTYSPSHEIGKVGHGVPPKCCWKVGYYQHRQIVYEGWVGMSWL